MKRSPILGYNHNVRYAGRLWHIQTEDSGVNNPRIFTHLFHEGTILATGRGDYDATLEVPAVQKLMQEQHKQLLRELKNGAFDEKIERFFGAPVARDSSGTGPLVEAPPRELPQPVIAVDLSGPMTDPSIPVMIMPIVEPADFDSEDSIEITVELGTFESSTQSPESAATRETAPMPVVMPPARPRSNTPPPTRPRSNTPPPASTSTTETRRASQVVARPAESRFASAASQRATRPTDDPLSQIPIFSASSAPSPVVPTTPPRRDATPLRVPTRETASLSRPVPALAPRRPPPIDAGASPRHSSLQGLVKPTSEGVVVGRPAVVIGGSAPQAAAQRGVPQKPLSPAANRWHQSGVPGAPRPAGASPRGKGFGSDLISERSLDEVILAYLSEDAKDK